MPLLVKTSLALSAALLTTTSVSMAKPHRVAVSAEAGVGATFDLGVDAGKTTGTLTTDGNAVYGGRVSYRVHPTGFVYLSYHRELTTVYFRPTGQFVPTTSAPISFDQVQFGGRLEVPRGKVFPFAGFGVGALRIGSQETSASSLAFSMSLDMGVRVELLPFLHVALVGRLPVTFVNGGSGAICVNGGCLFAYHGDPLVQAQGLLGAGVQF
jgi:hypothetical protein